MASPMMRLECLWMVPLFREKSRRTIMLDSTCGSGYLMETVGLRKQPRPSWSIMSPRVFPRTIDHRTPEKVNPT